MFSVLATIRLAADIKAKADKRRVNFVLFLDRDGLLASINAVFSSVKLWVSALPLKAPFLRLSEIRQEKYFIEIRFDYQVTFRVSSLFVTVHFWRCQGGFQMFASRNGQTYEPALIGSITTDDFLWFIYIFLKVRSIYSSWIWSLRNVKFHHNVAKRLTNGLSKSCCLSYFLWLFIVESIYTSVIR